MSDASSIPSVGTPAPRVVAVVVTYNRKALLERCLRALQAQTHALAAIRVVDNASTDGTAAFVREAFPDIELRELPANAGGAGGFAAGFAWATKQTADWVWVMDDDVEPEPDALAQLFAPGLHADAGTVGLASLRLGFDGQPQPLQTGWYDPVRMRLSPAPADQGPVRIGYGSFAGTLFRLDAVRRAGLPEAGYFIWYDDVEYSLRLARLGRQYLVPASLVHHHNPFNAARARANATPRRRPVRPYAQVWRSYYSLRNRLLTLRAHRHGLARLAGYGFGIYYLLRSLLAVIIWDDRKRARAGLLLRAFRDGVQGRLGRRVDPAAFREETA